MTVFAEGRILPLWVQLSCFAQTPLAFQVSGGVLGAVSVYLEKLDLTACEHLALAILCSLTASPRTQQHVSIMQS